MLFNKSNGSYVETDRTYLLVSSVSSLDVDYWDFNGLLHATCCQLLSLKGEKGKRQSEKNRGS